MEANKQQSHNGMRMLFAGISAVVAGTVVHPVETIKTRMQIMGEIGAKSKVNYGGSFLSTGQTLVNNEGIKGLYKGLKPSQLREAVYSTLRLGLYEPYKELLGAHDKSHTPFYIKALAGAMSGLTGSVIANPTDVVKIRMQASEHNDHGVRWHIKDIYHNQGMKGFYKGVQATVARAIMVNATMLSTYDHIKHTLINLGLFKEGYVLHFISSMVTGVTMTFTTAPFDIARTRLMNQPYEIQLYKGLFDCMIKTKRNEGFLALYKGFTPQWLRFGPYATVQFMTWELLRKLYGMEGI